MTKLAEVDGVACVVGSFASSVSSAAVPIAVLNNVMLISPCSTSPVFTERAQNGEIREAISGQICRCTGYSTIVRSVQWAAAEEAGTRTAVTTS